MKIEYKGLKSLKYIKLPSFDKDRYKSILVLIRGDFGGISIKLNSGMETTIQMNGSVKKRITESLINKLVYQNRYFEKISNIKKNRLVKWSMVNSSLYGGSVRACITESKKALRTLLQGVLREKAIKPLFLGRIFFPHKFYKCGNYSSKILSFLILFCHPYK